MKLLFCLGLMLSAPSAELVDEIYRIPAGDWRYVAVSLHQQPALLAADIRSTDGARDIRAALVPMEDLDRARKGWPRGALAETDSGASCRLRYYARAPGDYAVVVENRDSDREAAVRVRVWLDFGAVREMEVTQISPRRRLAVILISFAFFFGIVTWSARRLLQHIGKPES